MKHRPFAPENNPLRDVRVEIPKKSKLREALEELTKDVDMETPASKNFKLAERRNPTKKPKHGNHF